ncbi:MAG: hypothetical protein ABIP17_02265 [Ilumatobacteraceae bacterium]
MSWIERSIEEVLANAAATGALDTPELTGRQLDLDTQRSQGWWADQFTRRELSHDRRRVAEAAAAQARIGFWRADTSGDLHDRVREANEAIARANINLVDGDRLVPFDPFDIEDRWRRLRRT